MIIDDRELERPRTPTELRRYVSDLFARIGAIEHEKHAARLWTDSYKYLMREIYPLSIFCAWRYPLDDVIVKPCIGNQGYDAEIVHTTTQVRTRVEVGWPIDGKREKQDSRDLNANGRTAFHVDDHDEGKALVRKRMQAALSDKAQKDYSDAFLILVLNLWPTFYLDNERDHKDIKALLQDMRAIPVKAKAVYAVLMEPAYVQKAGLEAVVEIRGELLPERNI